MLNYEELKQRPADFLCATGLTVAEFERLLPPFSQVYQGKYGGDQTVEGKPRQRKAGGGAKGKLPAMADKLLFILVYEKTYPWQTMHGLAFGLSQERANEWIHRLLPVLQETLAVLGMRPERDAQALAHTDLMQELPADWVLDGTERRRQRPQDQQQQVDHYRGKQKAHTDKNLVLINGVSGQVGYLSPTEVGKRHDKRLADEQPLAYPPGTTLGKDTGFQGYEPPGVVTYQPKKKPRQGQLAAEDKFLNKIFSAIRIQVEHVIGGIKRCRIVKDTFRNTKEGFADLVMEVACGLHNFRMACRHPLPTLNLLDLCI